MKKSSYDWLKQPEFKTLIILDPDGWDRSPENYENSMNELITQDEFDNRVGVSTIQWNVRDMLKYFESRNK